MEFWMIPAGFLLFVLVAVAIFSGILGTSKEIRGEAKRCVFEEPDTDRFESSHKRSRRRHTTSTGPK